MCSCSKGFNRAACKHQAAVAKVFNVCTANLAPYYSKEAKKMFADLAMGEKSMATEFYADLRSPTHANSSAVTENTDNSANSSALAENTENGAEHENDCSSLEPTSDNMDCDGPDPLKEQIENFHASLREIEDDIIMRVKEADHNFISGLCKFISTYTKMRKSSHAPTSTIAYAFHNFGRSDSKSVISTTA